MWLPSTSVRTGLVLPRRVDPRGIAGPTKNQARGPRWRKTSHGYYVPSNVSDERVEQRIYEASVVVPPGLGITGWAALRWCGGRWFDGRDHTGNRRPVVVAISTHDVRPQPHHGIEVTGEGLDPRMVHVLDGVQITRPVWSVSFEMRYAANWRHAVAVLDMAAYSDLVSVAEQAEFIGRQRGWTGVPQARKALPYAAENSWSLPESLMRLVWEVDAELPRPLCNVPIFDLQGRHLGTPDLFDADVGLMGEYDGAVHLSREQRSRDIKREALLRSHDLESVIMTADDFVDVDQFVTRLRRAYAVAERRRSGSRRPWTLRPPDWWIPTETVEQRRALAEHDRLRLLRGRVA